MKATTHGHTGRSAGSLQPRPTFKMNRHAEDERAVPRWSVLLATCTAWAGCAAARPGTPGEARRASNADSRMGRPAERRVATEGLRPVERVRTAQQRGWGSGDPYETPLEAEISETDASFRSKKGNTPSNDIEFSGEEEGAQRLTPSPLQ